MTAAKKDILSCTEIFVQLQCTALITLNLLGCVINALLRTSVCYYLVFCRHHPVWEDVLWMSASQKQGNFDVEKGHGEAEPFCYREVDLCISSCSFSTDGGRPMQGMAPFTQMCFFLSQRHVGEMGYSELDSV